MSEKYPTEHLLKRFEAAERDALDGLLRRIGKTEAKIAATVGKIPSSLGRELDSIRGRIEAARRDTENRIEEFRAKLVDGPLSEEELRARIVMLEMEYASRVRLAEQGFSLLAERFEDHVASGRHWLTDVCDQVRQAVRIDVKPVRARLGEALAEKTRALAARERELEELRGGRVPLKNDDLEARLLEMSREAARYKTENEELSGRLASVQGEADRLLDQLRVKESESAKTETRLIDELRETISPLLDERLGLRNRIKALEERVQVLKKTGGGAQQKRIEEMGRDIEEKDAALGDLLKELSGYREAAGRFRSRVQTVELELASAKAELKEFRQERRGLVERFHAAAHARDAERKRAESAEALLEKAGQERPPTAKQDKAEDARVLKLEMKLAAAAKGLAAVREKVRASRARIMELEERTVPEREHTLDIDAEKADLAQRIEGERRKSAALAEELENKTAALDAAENECAALRKRLEETPAADAAASKRLERERESAKLLQRRLLEADAARDRALADTRAQWAEEQERYEEQLAAGTRQIGMLRNQLAAVENSWQQTLAGQDAVRMQEIFKLRAEIQELKWRVEAKEKGK